MNGRPKISYRFGDYQLTPEERSLTRSGEPVQLPPKAFDILVILVQNAGELVEKKDLLQLVWPDSFVEEGNIQVQISAIRKALRGNENGPFIETVPKIGYRFIADVEVDQGDGARQVFDPDDQAPTVPEVGGRPAVEPALPNSRRRRLVQFSIAILIIIGGALALVALRRDRAAPFQKVGIAKLTDGGKITDATISPDGTNLVYQRTENGRSSVWLKNLPTGAEKQILQASSAKVDSLLYSPDGEYIYFTRMGKDRSDDLFRIRVIGGEEEKLLEKMFGRISFSPDGKSIAFIRTDQIAVEFVLFTAAADGTDERRIATSKPAELIHFAAWSPRGDNIAVFRLSKEADDFGNRYDLLEVSTADGSMRKITDDKWQFVNYIEWVKGGEGLIVTGARRPSQPSQIWYIDHATGQSRQITNDPNDYSEVNIDAKSGQFVALMVQRHSAIWVGGLGNSGMKLAQLSAGAGSQEGDLGLSFMPEDRIAFTAMTDGNWDIWTMDASGGGRTRLTAGEFRDFGPLVTADGKIVYVSQVSRGMTHIWKMDLDGGNKTQLTNGLFEDWPAVSADGRWLVYTGGDSATDVKLWKLPIDGGTPAKLSDLPIRSVPTISPDGSLVAFASLGSADPNTHKIYFISSDTGEPVKVVDAPPGFVPNTVIQWTPDGRAITYKSGIGQGSSLWNLPFDGSPPMELYRSENGMIFKFAWSPDGRLAVVTRNDSTDVVMIKDQS